MIRVFLILSLSLGLSGCSGTSEEFDCPYGKGRACHSLSEISRVLDQEDHRPRSPSSDPEVYIVKASPIFLHSSFGSLQEREGF